MQPSRYDTWESSSAMMSVRSNCTAHSSEQDVTHAQGESTCPQQRFLLLHSGLHPCHLHHPQHFRQDRSGKGLLRPC